MAVALDQRVGIFVDVQNMFYATKHLYGSKLNFGKMMEFIARERRLARAIAYVVQTPDGDQSNFFAMLHSNNYEVRSKDLKLRPDGSAKGDWDMGLALDALAMSERLDVVAIVSGDGDFVDLVNFLKARGVRVEVYSFAYSTSEELRQVATEYYQMGPDMVMNPSARPNYNPNYNSNSSSNYNSENRYDSGAGERRSFAPRQHENRTYENRTYENRPYENRPYENRPYENRPYENRVVTEDASTPAPEEDDLLTREL